MAMAQSTELGEKEFALIQQIAKNPSVTQRGLSESTGLSLGTTNLLVRRLARKGLIKINQLDWKRASYLLTLKGAAEKSQKAYRYTLYTWRIFRQIAGNIGAVLRREYDAGRRRFWLVAEDEILELLKEEIQNLGLVGTNVSFYKSLAGLPKEADIVLTATLELPPSSENGRRFIRLVDFDNIDFKA